MKDFFRKKFNFYWHCQTQPRAVSNTGSMTSWCKQIGSTMYWGIETHGSAPWMTSPMTSAITLSIRIAIVLVFAIVLQECVECIAQGHVTGATPYCAMLRSLGGGTTARRQNLKVLRLSWNLVRVCPTRWRHRFYVKMTSSRCHAHLTHLLREKSKCSDRAENLHDCTLDIARHDSGVYFAWKWRHHAATSILLTC